MPLLAGRVLFVIVGLTFSVTENYEQTRSVSAYNGICKPSLMSVFFDTESDT